MGQTVTGNSTPDDSWNVANLVNAQTLDEIGTTHSRKNTQWQGSDSQSASTSKSAPANSDAQVPVLAPPRTTSGSGNGQTFSSSSDASTAPEDTTVVLNDLYKTKVKDSLTAQLMLQSKYQRLNDPNLSPTDKAQLQLQFNSDLSMANFARLNPNSNLVSTDTKALVAAAQNFAASAVKSATGPDGALLAPSDWTPPAESSFSKTYQSIMDTVLGNMAQQTKPQYSQKQLQALEFALYHPELVDASTLEQLKSSGLQENINAEFRKRVIAIPGGWAPDTSSYDDSLSAKINAAFGKLLDQYVIDHELSQKDSNQLRLLHYDPNLAVVDKARLMPMLAELNKSSWAATQITLGLPTTTNSSWVPPSISNADLIAGSLNVNFQHLNVKNLNAAIKNAQPPLTQQEIISLRKAFTDPTSSNIPDKIQKMAASITAQSIAEIQAAQGIPGWQPTGPALWQGAILVLNGLTYLDQTKAALEIVFKSSPDGINYMSFLTAIAAAIEKLQAQVYAMEKAQTDGMMAQQNAMKDVMKFQVDAHKKQQDEMKAQQAELDSKQAKAAKTSGIMKIVGPIVMAVAILAAVASFGTLGPGAIVVTCLMLSLMIADSVQPGAMALVMSNIPIPISLILKKAGVDSKIADIVGKCVGVAFIIALSMAGGNPATGITDAMALGAQGLASSGVITDTMSITGLMSAKDAALYGMIVGAAFQAAAMAGAARNLSNNMNAAVANVDDTIASASVTINGIRNNADVAGRSLTVLERGQILMQEIKLSIGESARTFLVNPNQSTAIQTFSSSLKTASAGVGVNNAVNQQGIYDIQGDMAKISVDQKVTAAKTQRQIESLKELIEQMQKLLQSLSGRGAKSQQDIGEMFKDYTVRPV